MNIVLLKGEDKTKDIQEYFIKDEKLYVTFKNNKTYAYAKSSFEILPKATNVKVFCYLKELSHIVSEDNELDHLKKRYSEITYIPKDCVLSAYLNLSSFVYETQSNLNPILAPFGLNMSQSKALKNALCSQTSIIEGPPGTGKTQTILNIIANLIYRGKTIAVLSNNNAATQNIYQKLNKYGLDYLCANLGNKDNKKQFIEQQSGIYGEFDTKELHIEKMKHDINESYQNLHKIFELQNEIATNKEILESLKLEYEYFKKQEYQNTISLKTRLFQKPTSHRILMIKIILEESKYISKIPLWLKLKMMYWYGIGDFDLYAKSKQEILKIFENFYYTHKIEELQTKIDTMQQSLEKLNAKNPLKTLQDSSLALLQYHLQRKYKNNSTRKIFTSDDLVNNTKEFLQEYPIVFSTTHSILSSLGRISENPLFDYVIIDESSQVDIVSGALALLCAKNAVIVGDTKQLPNIIEQKYQKDIQDKNAKYNIPEYHDYSKHSLLSSMNCIVDSDFRVLLKEHYRCHPKIIGFCNKKFYNNELIILSQEESKLNVLEAYITSKGNHARGHYNQREIDVIKKEILPPLQKCFDKDEIGIISPYKTQKEHLEKDIVDLQIDTVHKYQGREKEAIILTMVNNVIGDFIDNENMLNVAVSRAKSALRIVVSHNIATSNNNISDFIKYIQYHNGEVVQSEVKSIFDLLYKANHQARLLYLKNKKKISQFDSENLAFYTIQECLKPYSALDVVSHIPLSRVIGDSSVLDEKQKQYAYNPLTHIDFVIYNIMDKIPVCAIEVDGFAFHNSATQQFKNDELKDAILQKCHIPLLRLRTNGSDERGRIEAILSEIMEKGEGAI